MPEKPLKHYTYFARNEQGQVQQLPISGWGPTPPTPEMVEQMYQAMCQQAAAKGNFNVPRPTHVKVDVLHELPPAKDAPKHPLIVVPRGRNGAK